MKVILDSNKGTEKLKARIRHHNTNSNYCFFCGKNRYTSWDLDCGYNIHLFPKLIKLFKEFGKRRRILVCKECYDKCQDIQNRVVKINLFTKDCGVAVKDFDIYLKERIEDKL
jgi:hypothetical protein